MKHGVSPRLTFESGFTLTELAVVMVIVALLIGGLLMPLAAQDDVRRTQETQKTLSDIREALIGFTASHGAPSKPYLPCPDTDDDGAENRKADGNCTSQEGRIPWSTLGLGQTDAWGNRYRYRVSAAFSHSIDGFALTTGGTLRVCGENTCATTLAIEVPAVIVSHGKNGAGAFNSTGSTNTAPAGAVELENTDGDNDFVSRIPDPTFDDLVIWLSPNILYNRMIAAGRLP